MKNKAIFLDRDGTINIEKNYMYKIEDFEFENGVVDSLKIFQKLGFKLIIISNQSGIGRGYYSEKEVNQLFEYMIGELRKNEIYIDKYYYCPHYQEECDCRKPKLGLFYKAQKEFDIDFSKSYAIGDKLRDVAICKSEEVKGFIITKEKIQVEDNIKIVDNILQSAHIIEKER